MSSPADFVPAIELSPDDAESVRAALRDKVPAGNRLVVMALSSLADVRLTERVIRTLISVRNERKARITDDNIQKLLDIYLEAEPRAEIDLELERDNAQLRAEYLKSVATLTSSDIRAFLGNDAPRNPSEPASRWKREKRIFAIPYGPTDLFPAFQFADGAPRPVMRHILDAMPAEMTPWQIAFWFASGNGWLDGKLPQECLDASDDVLDAARRLGDPAVG